jgi:hypothetical protein
MSIEFILNSKTRYFDSFSKSIYKVILRNRLKILETSYFGKGGGRDFLKSNIFIENQSIALTENQSIALTEIFF